jgi:methionine synthase I (cobalamin-dependent)
MRLLSGGTTTSSSNAPLTARNRGWPKRLRDLRAQSSSWTSSWLAVDGGGCGTTETHVRVQGRGKQHAKSTS